MFAVRFFAAATLAAAVPCASATEPVSSKLSQLSLTSPRPQPVVMSLLPADSLASTSNRIAVTPFVDTSTGQLRNPQLSSLVTVYPSAGTSGLELTLNLQSAPSTDLQEANLLTSLTTRIQMLSTPTAVQPAASWLTPQVASELFTKPKTYGAGLRYDGLRVER